MFQFTPEEELVSVVLEFAEERVDEDDNDDDDEEEESSSFLLWI